MLKVSQPCILRVGVIGINFKTADLPFREAVARGAESLSPERARFFRHPTVLLSTCNRTEIYFSADNLAEAHSDLLALLRSQIEEPFEARLYCYFGIDCFAHLCRVSAGIDSAILAETEILRQVKVAYEKSSQAFALPSCMHYLFQKSLKVAKGVRSHLELERGAPTLFSTIWEITTRELGDLAKRQILLVGYSEINRRLASFLAHRGVAQFTFCTEQKVQLERGKVVDRSALSQWQDYDLILSASRADDYLIRGESSRKNLIFDLSVPRNVDPAVGATLYNIEQLDQLIELKRTAQNHCLEKCEGMLWENVVRLAQIYRQKVLQTQYA